MIDVDFIDSREIFLPMSTIIKMLENLLVQF